MAVRTARTAWNGGLTEGSGQVELSSSRIGTYDVSWPRRTSEAADGVTSPEELVAAAHSSCFAMQLSHLLEEAGGTPQSLEVTADITFGPDPAGGFHLEEIALRVVGEVEGLDAAAFDKVAQEAKATCPVSKALTGVPITLQASLA